MLQIRISDGGEDMVSWLARGILLLSGFITSWFIAKDEPTFGGFQMAVGLLLLALIVFVIAFWPTQWFRHRKQH
jgi:formate hydrogenlyase subunit 3/multisubunit Na+/H+ antiporter MnhD subunit